MTLQETLDKLVGQRVKLKGAGGQYGFELGQLEEVGQDFVTLRLNSNTHAKVYTLKIVPLHKVDSIEVVKGLDK